MAERKLEIVFLGNPKPAQAAMQQLSQSAGGLQAKIGGLEGSFSKVATVAGGFLLGNAITKGPSALMGLSDTARDLELQLKKASIVFGDQLPLVQQWAAGSAAAMGLTKTQAVNLAAGLQDLLVPMGMNREEAAALSTKTIGLAGALAEWSGGAKSATDVAQILTSAYLGETDGLKALGISISAAEVEGRLLAKGQQDLTGTARQQAEALAIQEMIFEKSTDAQKAFADGADSAARKKALMTARIQEAKEALARGLAPAFVAVATGLATVAIPALEAFSEHVGPVLASAIEGAKPVLLSLGEGLRAVAGWMRDALIPAVREFVATDIVPALEAARGVFEAIAPRVAELASTVAEKLQPALTAVLGFLTAHQEILGGVAAVIGGALVAAFAAWAVSAGAAAVATIVAIAPAIAIGLALAALAAGIIWLVKNWDDLERKYPSLAQASEALREKFAAFSAWITGSFVPAVAAIATAVTKAVTDAVAFVRAHWDEIRAVIEPALKALAAIVEAAWRQVRIHFETAFAVLRGLVDVFMGVFTGDWDRAWQGVKEVVRAAWEGIRASVENGIALVKGLAPLMLDAARALGSALLDGLKAALSATAGFAGDVGQAVLEAVKRVLNEQVIDRLNAALEFNISVPLGPDIHVNPPDIPRLARGGIVVAGDNPSGIEAIVPLERAREFGFGGREGGVEVHNHFHFSGFVGDVDELLRQLQLAARRAGRGGVFA